VGTTIPDAKGDPFAPPLLANGVWNPARLGHRLVYIGEDTVLDWEKATGKYALYKFDRKRRPVADPLAGPSVCSGTWPGIIDGHDIVYLGENRLLTWELSTRRYRVWLIDRTATGATDPLGGGAPQTNGVWADIDGGHRIVALGGRRVLVWKASAGTNRIFQHDPAAVGAADPLPGPPVATGFWTGMQSGYRAISVGNDRVLLWLPSTGDLRILLYDRTSAGNAFPGDPEVTGNSPSIRDGHELVYLDGERLLDWQPGTGTFEVRRYDRGICTLRKATVRLHLKILVEPMGAKVDEMVKQAKALYASYGFDIVEVSRESLVGNASYDRFRGLIVGDCRRSDGPTPSQTEMYTQLRGGLGPTDVVAYYIREMIYPAAGCAIHPQDMPSLVIARSDCTEWTLAHELAHVLGCDHTEDDETDRLMIPRNTYALKVTPRLIGTELLTMLASRYCVKATP
jgi:hypothetical protein